MRKQRGLGDDRGIFWRLGVGLRRSLWMLIKGLFWPLTAFLRYFRRTQSRRKLIHLVQGLPALIILTGLFGLGIAVSLNASNLTGDYKDLAVLSLRREEYELARMYLERVIDLEGPTSEVLFDLSQALEKLNETERAKAILVKLAPDDKPGFARAHLKRGQNLLTDPRSFQSREVLQQAIKHFEFAKRMLPNIPELEVGLAQANLALGAEESATAYLVRAAQLDGRYNYELFRMHLMRGDAQRASRAARDADSYLMKKVTADPGDVDARLRWANLRASYGDFEMALKVLREGRAAKPDSRYDQVIVATLVTKFDVFEQLRTSGEPIKSKNESPPPTKQEILTEQLNILRECLRMIPDSAEAVSRLANFGIGEADTEVTEMLEGMITSGKGADFAHFALGVRAWKAENTQNAIFHLERAYKLDPKLTPVANNLAWLLAFSETPDLERALALINSVLEVDSSDPDYRDTRGQILAKMGRLKEALVDLEAALPHMPQNRQLHTALIAVYQGLNQPNLALRHEQILSTLPPDTGP